MNKCVWKQSTRRVDCQTNSDDPDHRGRFVVCCGKKRLFLARIPLSACPQTFWNDRDRWPDDTHEHVLWCQRKPCSHGLGNGRQGTHLKDLALWGPKYFTPVLCLFSEVSCQIFFLKIISFGIYNLTWLPWKPYCLGIIGCPAHNIEGETQYSNCGRQSWSDILQT